jgi:hypothetical protein
MIGRYVDTEHRLIITHEATNVGSDRSKLANVAKQANQFRRWNSSKLLPIAATLMESKSWRASRLASR